MRLQQNFSGTIGDFPCCLRSGRGAIVARGARSARAHPRCGEVECAGVLRNGRDAVRASCAENHRQRAGRFASRGKSSPPDGGLETANDRGRRGSRRRYLGRGGFPRRRRRSSHRKISWSHRSRRRTVVAGNTWSRKFGAGRNRMNGCCSARTSIRRIPDPAAIDEACNAALVIEAARDIQLTGVHPRRSIRFVLFGGESQA